jgi:hypothetical protein
MTACISEVVIPPKVLPTKIVVLLTGATMTLLRKSNFLSHIIYEPKNTDEKITDILITPGNINCWYVTPEVDIGPNMLSPLIEFSDGLFITAPNPPPITNSHNNGVNVDAMSRLLSLKKTLNSLSHIAYNFSISSHIAYNSNHFTCDI